MTTSPRILVFGTGALGTVYSWILHRAGASLVTVCRSNYEVAKADGFTIKSEIFGHGSYRPAAVVRSVSEAVEHCPEQFDFIIVCSKAFPGSNPKQADLISPAVTKSTTAIVLMQNGVAIESEYAELFPDNPIISVVAYVPATQTSPAVVLHKELELLHIGTFPATAPVAHKAVAESFTNLIRKGGASAELHDDVQVERWQKLMVNASWNPICALTRSRDAHFLLSSPDALEFVRNIMFEIKSVAQACGYDAVTDVMVESQLRRAQVRDLPGVEPSMMADALSGRVMEVEAIVGNAVRIAREKGVQVPNLHALYVLGKALDKSIHR